MKTLCLVTSLFLLAVGASAQTLPASSDPSAVTVIEKKWHVELRNPALDEDPFLVNDQMEQDMRDRKETIRQNEARNRVGLPPQPPPNRVGRGPIRVRGVSAIYIYEFKFRNTADKAIRALTWDYVFFEPGTEVELGRQTFVSKVSLGSGKTRNMIFQSASPPTGSIDATKVDKQSKDQYAEQVVIQSIEYADGTVWRAPSP